VITARDAKVMIVGGAGGAAGVAFSEFVSEFVSKYFELTGTKRLAVKGVIKVIFGIIFWLIAGRLTGLGSLFFEIASYGSFASIALDIVDYFVPGGATGAAVATAVSMKGVPARAVAEIIERPRSEAVSVTVRG